MLLIQGFLPDVNLSQRIILRAGEGTRCMEASIHVYPGFFVLPIEDAIVSCNTRLVSGFEACTNCYEYNRDFMSHMCMNFKLLRQVMLSGHA